MPYCHSSTSLSSYDEWSTIKHIEDLFKTKIAYFSWQAISENIINFFLSKISATFSVGMDSNTDMIGLFSIELMSQLKSHHITQGKMDELDIKTAFWLLAKIIVKQECWRSFKYW